VARAIGIGALKYADLSTSRTSNYVFSFDRMLSLKGNTAPYLQYAHTRMRSILREGGEPPAGTAVVLAEESEVELAKRLAALPDAVDRVVGDDAPNHLCAALPPGPVRHRRHRAPRRARPARHRDAGAVVAGEGPG
jgi:arginyl-tRNA synthetase